MWWDQQRNAQMMQTRRNGKENAMFAPLYTKNAQFTKTGSGKTQGKLNQKVVFSLGCGGR